MASAADKVALVVAVGDYHADPLANSINDAKAMNDGLLRSGFRVICCTDPERADLIESVHEFSSLLPASTLAVFFYSGHGGVKNGQHYMLTREWDGSGSDSALEKAGYAVEEVMNKMKAKGSKQNLVMLDACRILLPGRAAGPPKPTHGWGGSMSTYADFLVCHACENLTRAHDGIPGGNGTYTRQLLKHLFSDKPIHIAISEANKAVQEETGEEQNPRMETCDMRPFMFPLNPSGTAVNENENVDAHIWNSCECDGCGVKPIIGRRYRCMDCPTPPIYGGYDLCGECMDYDSAIVTEAMIHENWHRMSLMDPTAHALSPPQPYVRPCAAMQPVYVVSSNIHPPPRRWYCWPGCC